MQNVLYISLLLLAVLIYPHNAAQSGSQLLQGRRSRYAAKPKPGGYAHIGVVCLWRDNPDRTWMRSICEEVAKVCGADRRMTLVHSAQMDGRELLEVSFSKKVLDWRPEQQIYNDYRLIFFIAAHGSKPTMERTGFFSSTREQCGGTIGSVPFADVADMLVGMNEHRLSTYNSQTLLMTTACFSGLLQTTKEYQSNPFPMITIKGEASGSVSTVNDFIINDQILQLFRRTVTISWNQFFVALHKNLGRSGMVDKLAEFAIPKYGMERAAELLGDQEGLMQVVRDLWRKTIATEVVPRVLMMREPHGFSTSEDGFRFASLTMEDRDTHLEDETTSWQLLSPKKFSFQEWNLDPKYVEVWNGGVSECTGDRLVTLTTGNGGRIDAHPVSIIRRKIERGGGQADSEKDLDASFVRYVGGEPEVRSLPCVPSTVAQRRTFVSERVAWSIEHLEKLTEPIPILELSLEDFIGPDIGPSMDVKRRESSDSVEDLTPLVVKKTPDTNATKLVHVSASFLTKTHVPIVLTLSILGGLWFGFHKCCSKPKETEVISFDYEEF